MIVEDSSRARMARDNDVSSRLFRFYAAVSIGHASGSLSGAAHFSRQGRRLISRALPRKQVSPFLGARCFTTLCKDGDLFTMALENS